MDETLVTPKIQVQHLNFYYGVKQALMDITLDIAPQEIMAFIGPSGCGKSTFLRCLNRMNDEIPRTRVEGQILLDDADIYAPDVDIVELRRRVGLVFQKPNPFPQSIFNNIVMGPRSLGLETGSALGDMAQRFLQEVDLWDEIKGDMSLPAMSLSLGQQQRLCIARTLAVRPEVILMDEPCSALDVEGTRAIEELMFQLRGRYTIVIVTHNMAQARRTSDECLFMLLGEMVEHARTADLFLNPRDSRTAEYIEGRYG